MALFIDARIPIAFGVTPTASDIVLHTDPGWAQAHETGCACCTARPPAAWALDSLFVSRVRGTIPWFERVVVASDAEAAVRSALNDAVIAARFRPA